MATVALAASAASTSNLNSYVLNIGTPVAGDLLIVFTGMADTTDADSSVSSDAGLAFTRISSQNRSSGAHRLQAWVSDGFATDVSQSVTWSNPSDAATGAVIACYRVAGMSRSGLNAILQSGGENASAGVAGTIPDPTFAANVDTANPTLGAVYNGTNPATLTPPTDWTEGQDQGHSTPAGGMESVFRNSGFTGNQITWGSASASAYCDIILELDASAADGPAFAGHLALLGVGA